MNRFATPARLFTSVFIASLVATSSLELSAEEKQPNVVFIAVDDLRPWVGAMGFPAAKTPNIDRLASRSVTFSRAYTAAPWCQPSRTALLTGILPSSSGVYSHWDEPWRASPALKRQPTLPQTFRHAGYEVVGAGKIFHHTSAAQDPDSWERYWPSQTRCMLTLKLANPPLNGLILRPTVDWGAIDVPTAEMPDQQVADFVVSELSQPHERPFFLGCGFYLPHLPWYVPQEYLDRFPIDQIPLPPLLENDLDDIGSYGRRFALGEGLPDPDDENDYGSGKGIFEKIRNGGKWQEAVRAYLAAIAFADDCVGRVLDAIESRPDARDTIVCLWSDHGWHLGEKHHWEKVTLWEEATRVVLMVSAPGRVAGRQCSHVVNLMDLHPTLQELCGVPVTPNLQCRSLVPLLENPEADWSHPTVTTHGRGNYAVRDERYRYIRYRNGEEELYDHQNDPLEWRNIAANSSSKAVIEQLRIHLPLREAPPLVTESKKK